MGNSPETGEFPAQMASYAENVSIWWRHHDIIIIYDENINIDSKKKQLWTLVGMISKDLWNCEKNSVHITLLNG